MTVLERFPHRLTLVTGHYGTGKTEFSVNLALALAEAGERTALADLDIVNPYFRSRERRELLAAAGVRLYGGGSGEADAAVAAFLAGELAYDPEVHCDHHGEGHHHGGDCGSGGCGHHSCG